MISLVSLSKPNDDPAPPGMTHTIFLSCALHLINKNKFVLGSVGSESLKDKNIRP